MVTHPGRSLGHLEKSESFFLAPQFQTELRKILVSLIEVAQKLLALNPDAVELFKKANGMSAPRGTGSCVQTPPRAPTSEAGSAAHGPHSHSSRSPRQYWEHQSVHVSCGRGAPAPPAGRGLRVHVLRFRGLGLQVGPSGSRLGAALALAWSSQMAPSLARSDAGRGGGWQSGRGRPAAAH